VVPRFRARVLGRGGVVVCFRTPIVNQIEDIQLAEAWVTLKNAYPDVSREDYIDDRAIAPYNGDWDVTT
jgi:hypothetical protein